MKLVMLEVDPVSRELQNLMIERKDGTLVKLTDEGFRTLSENLKRQRHYDWRDLEIVNDAIKEVTDVRKKKK
jgi:hypothetical protein